MRQGPVTPRSMPCTGWVPGGCTGWGMGTGWVYRVGVPGTTLHRARTSLRQRSGPVGPAGAGVVVSGWGRVSWVPPFGPGRSGQPALPVPRTRSQVPHNAVQTAKTSENSHISVKLVKTAECHQKTSIRPVIVPVSKTGFKCRLLIFWDLRFR